MNYPLTDFDMSRCGLLIAPPNKLWVCSYSERWSSPDWIVPAPSADAAMDLLQTNCLQGIHDVERVSVAGAAVSTYMLQWGYDETDPRDGKSFLKIKEWTL